MWDIKCVIILGIIGATGIVTKTLRETFVSHTRKHSVGSVQQTAVLGTSRLIRKVLQCETGSLSDGDRRWFKRSTWEKRPVTGDGDGDDNNNNNNNNNNRLLLSHLHIPLLFPDNEEVLHF